MFEQNIYNSLVDFFIGGNVHKFLQLSTGFYALKYIRPF